MEIQGKLSRPTKNAYLLRPTRYDLGARRRTYRGRPLKWRDLFLIFFPATGGVLFPLAYGTWIFNNKYLQYGPIAAEYWSRPWILLAVFAMTCLVLLAIIRIFQSQKYVSTYQNGLVIRIYPLRKIIIKWSEISEITTLANKITFIGYILQETFSIILCSTYGNSILLDNNIRSMTELAKEIKLNTFRHLLPIFQHEINRGHRVNFGAISMNKEWISLGKNKISWHEVSKVYVNSGFMVIKLMDNNKLKIKISKIPNIDLLFLLLPRGIKL